MRVVKPLVKILPSVATINAGVRVSLLCWYNQAKCIAPKLATGSLCSLGVFLRQAAAIRQGVDQDDRTDSGARVAWHLL